MNAGNLLLRHYEGFQRPHGLASHFQGTLGELAGARWPPRRRWFCDRRRPVSGRLCLLSHLALLPLLHPRLLGRKTLAPNCPQFTGPLDKLQRALLLELYLAAQLAEALIEATLALVCQGVAFVGLAVALVSPDVALVGLALSLVG